MYSRPTTRNPLFLRPRIRWAAAVTAVVLVAAVAGWLVPRGPVTTPQALVTLTAMALLGLLVGWSARSRWAAFLGGPATFAATFELTRMRIDGPTVDGLRLDGAYGVMALIAGRGIDALLMLFPMVVGVAWGRRLARRTGMPYGAVAVRRSPLRQAPLVLGTAALLVLAAGLARPASTDAAVAADGTPAPGSIAELVEVDVGGSGQSIMLRGVSEQAPVLLFLEGGPGGTALGRIRNSGEDLEQHFVVAVWDQRGTGKSYDALEPTSTLTVEQMVDDTLAVTEYLRDRFDQRKIYLVGSSWGTVLGTFAVQRAPQLFHAYVGTGQMVDPFETDRLMYAESLADARARGDGGTVRALEELGEPPYEDTLDYPPAIASNPRWRDFPHGDDYRASSEYPLSLFVEEYALIEQLRGTAAIAETFDVLYPQLSDVDLRLDVRRLDVPVHVVEGAHEAAGRETLARQWFERLSAPSKRYVVFDRSGHTPPYDEPGRFARLMRDVLREAG